MTVSFVFPKTAVDPSFTPAPITQLIIPSTIVPSIIREPINQISNSEWQGAITWSPVVTGTTFEPETVYTASISISLLYPELNTLDGITAASFDVSQLPAGTVLTYTNGIITIVFPETEALPTPAGWEMTYSFPYSATYNTESSSGQIPYTSWTGYDATNILMLSDDLWDMDYANLPVTLYAKGTADADWYAVPFDVTVEESTSSGQVKAWYFDNDTSTIRISGINSTGNPIALKLVWSGE
jgi:hypothetical protein